MNFEQPAAHHLDDWEFRPEDRLLFDTNIWLFLQDPFGDPTDSRVKAYSGAYARILKARCSIFTDSTVIGEFINRSLRLQHEADIRYGIADENWKNYRSSEEYGYALERITEITREILTQATLLESLNPDWEAVLQTLQSGQRDLSDELLITQCQKYGLIFVTDDGDFRGAPLSILSANSRLFRRR